ncbi:hypothetical protein IHV25_03325 [Phaeovibrio sulfidiphilus]|uniref:Uncharacterized protein n=1 Tax=Phaeovibrio sulfidiphilus TaxID=1220600 RepID=A0A8J6YY58_9PROT|nr:hypothetical protein [Phaeovibrio sulfidiphilus]MBE1236683.1 hypothetical protein [Phaeovibrio sulfidiphilus]
MLKALSGIIDLTEVAPPKKPGSGPSQPLNIHKDTRDTELERVVKAARGAVVTGMMGGPRIMALSGDPGSGAALSPAEARLAHRLATMSAGEREKAIDAMKEINAYLDRQEMDVSERYAAQFREQALKELGVSEEELEAMPDEQREEFEREIRKIIKKLMAEKAQEEEDRLLQNALVDQKDTERRA